jgi:hypothetical protein
LLLAALESATLAQVTPTTAGSRLYRPRPADALLILLLVVLPMGSLLRHARARPTRTVALIYQTGRLVTTQPLDRDTTIILSDNVARVRVEVSVGRVRVAESNCPNRLCVRTGWVSRAGRTIVCVPNRVLVLLQGETGGIDAESY